MNQNKADMVLTLAHAAKELAQVPGANIQVNEVLQEISNLVCRGASAKEPENSAQEGGPDVSNTGPAPEEGSELSDLFRVLKKLGVPVPGYALVRQGAPLSPDDSLSLGRARKLAMQLLEKKKRDLPFKGEADLLAAAGYAVVQL